MQPIFPFTCKTTFSFSFAYFLPVESALNKSHVTLKEKLEELSKTVPLQRFIEVENEVSRVNALLAAFKSANEALVR